MPQFAVATCMKNEGAFIVEWVAHYLALGFDRAIVLTNDCDDGTDLIADRLAALAPVTHLRNEVPEGGFAQEVGMAMLKSSGELAGVDWLLHCDADELLYLHMPDPDIGRFLGQLPECDAVAFDWRFAGTDLDAWPGGLVVDHCPRGSATMSKPETFSKTMFRPELFGAFSDHMPKAPVRDGVVIRNSLGQELPNKAMYHPRKSRYIRGATDHLSWQAAEMRHYALRSRQAFASKALRGFGIHPKPGNIRSDRNSGGVRTGRRSSWRLTRYGMRGCIRMWTVSLPIPNSPRCKPPPWRRSPIRWTCWRHSHDRFVIQALLVASRRAMDQSLGRGVAADPWPCDRARDRTCRAGGLRRDRHRQRVLSAQGHVEKAQQPDVRLGQRHADSAPGPF